MKSIKIDHYKFERILWAKVLSKRSTKGTEGMVLNIFIKALWYNIQNNIARRENEKY